MNKIIAYTDGACSENPGPGGWAAVINTHVNCERISGCDKNTTNNKMELRAVVECIRYVLSLECVKTKECNAVDICSDSAYVVNAVNKKWLVKWAMNGWRTAKGDFVKNDDIWKELISGFKKAKKMGVSINLVKVKGHAGNTFNEMVDSIAKAESQKAKRL